MTAYSQSLCHSFQIIFVVNWILDEDFLSISHDKLCDFLTLDSKSWGREIKYCTASQSTGQRMSGLSYKGKKKPGITLFQKVQLLRNGANYQKTWRAKIKGKELSFSMCSCWTEELFHLKTHQKYFFRLWGICLAQLPGGYNMHSMLWCPSVPQTALIILKNLTITADS